MLAQDINIFHKFRVSTQPRHSDLIFIIPAFNEEQCLDYVIKGIRKVAPDADILVINDGSTDNTGLVARRLGAEVLTLPHNLGIGGAVRAGLAFADELGYQVVVRMDGDGQHNPEDIPRLLDLVQGNQVDVAFGARFCEKGKSYCSSLLRRLGIAIYGCAVSLIIKQKIHDPTSGYWCLNRKAIRFFARYFPQDYPEVESHILLYKIGLRQAEVPVKMQARVGGRSSIGSLRSVYYAFKVLLAIFIRAIQDVPQIPQEEELIPC